MTARIPLTRGGRVAAFALVDETDHARLCLYRWHLTKNGYARRTRYRPGKSKGAVLMHREVLGLAADDARVSDHVNGNKIDNRRENLRAVTSWANKTNRRGGNRGSRSGVRGVAYNASTGKWRGYCGNRYLGQFDSPEAAGEAAASARAQAGYLAGASQTTQGTLAQTVEHRPAAGRTEVPGSSPGRAIPPSCPRGHPSLPSASTIPRSSKVIRP